MKLCYVCTSPATCQERGCEKKRLETEYAECFDKPLPGTFRLDIELTEAAATALLLQFWRKLGTSWLRAALLDEDYVLRRKG